MTPSRRHLRFSREGFTLLEVLVASAILGVVMMVLLSTLSTSMSLWRNTEGKAASDREARASGLLLAQDLANVVMPANPNLWPRVVTSRVGGENVVSLRFLTAKPGDYQTNAGDAGDVCYVEYAVLASPGGSGRELRRLFWPSGRTYSNVIASNSLPRGAQPQNEFQSLGLNLLPTNRMAARGLGALLNEANNTNFVLLATNNPTRALLPFTGTPSVSNFPVAVEVNFAVADPDILRNTDLLNNPRYILRNAGLYSTRYYLPKPPNAP
jgi:prepilin-type N-terminal cleavage/methylation domain-containing protein